MTNKDDKSKPKFTTNVLLKGAGITSLLGLITFLGTIYQSKESAASWRENVYYKDRIQIAKEQSEQGLTIRSNEERIYSLKKDLAEIKKNQFKMLDLLIRKK